MILTGVRGKQGAGLAVNDLLDDGHIHGRRHHAQAWYHGVHGGDAGHHAQVWVKIWMGRHSNTWDVKNRAAHLWGHSKTTKNTTTKKGLFFLLPTLPHCIVHCFASPEQFVCHLH